METVRVAMSEEFTVALQSIATTGYVWKIESLPGAIQLVGTETERAAGEARPGDSTRQVFRFRALAAGEYELAFALARPWENRARESRVVSVQVRDV